MRDAASLNYSAKRDLMITLTISRKTVFALTVVVVMVLTAIAAISAWQTGGSGNGYTKATTASALAIGDASASTTADLYPGATASVALKMTNPNPFPVKVTTVSLQSGGTISSNKGSACDASTGVTFTNQSGLTLALAANATQTFTLPGAASMSNASDNSCQGALFTIPVDVTAVSS